MSRRTLRRLGAGFSPVLLCTAVLAAHSAFAAATINVTTTAMTVAADGQCSLVEALQVTRTNATVNECAVGGGSPYTINLQSGQTYTSTAAAEADAATWGNSAFAAGANTTIQGNGSTLTQTSTNTRLFHVAGGETLTLRRLTLTGGNLTSAFDGTPRYRGGALAVDGTGVVNVEDSTFTGNTGNDAGSTLYAFGGGTANFHRVTAVSNTGTFLFSLESSAVLNIANSTMQNAPNGAFFSATVNSVVNISSSTLTGAFQVMATGPSVVSIRDSIVTMVCGTVGGTFNNTNNSGACGGVRSAPVLGVLASNGGLTQTYLPLLPNSGTNAAPGCAYLSNGTNPLFANGAAIAADQRGFARGATCDVGAVESFTVTPANGVLAGGTVSAPYSQSVTQAGGATPITFAVTSGSAPPGTSFSAAGTLSGTPTTAGNFAFTATLTDNSGLKTQTSLSVAIAKGSQTITFPVQSPASRSYSPGGTFAINPLATASSGLGVTYSVAPGSTCTVAGTTVTMTGVGPCTLLADQAGDSNYNPATQQAQAVTITKTPQSITFPAQSPASQVYSAGGTFAINPLASASSGLAVTYSAQAGSTCTIAGTTATITGAGNCVILANQGGDATFDVAPQQSQSVTIAKASQSITFPAQSPASQTFTPGGTFAINPVATASSGLAVTYSPAPGSPCTIAGTTVTMTGGGTCVIRADQAGNANYNAAGQQTQSVAIGKAAQTITFPPQTPASRTYSPGGTFSVVPLASASSGLAVTYSAQAGSSCTVAGTTVTMTSGGTCTILADQAGDANYAAATQQSQSVAIGKASQTITFPAQVPASRPYSPGGTFAVNPLATTTSPLAISYTVAPGSTCTVAGTTVTITAAGTCTLRADQAGDASYDAATQQAATVTITATVPDAPTIGTAAGGNTTAVVAFTGPSNDGSATIIDYTATCGAFSATGTSSPIIVPGLTNGTPYTCTVTARNSVGSGAPSAASNLVTPVLNAYTGPTATGTGLATVSFTGGGAGCSFAPTGNGPLQSAYFIPVSGHPKSPGMAPPSGVLFPEGLLDFVLIGCTPGDTVTLTVTYPTTVRFGSRYYKFGPTPGDASLHWYEMPAVIAGNTVTFTITDGGLGDDDLAANGTIVDQGGPGILPAGAVNVPTLSQWALLLMALLMGAAAAFEVRRRRR